MAVRCTFSTMSQFVAKSWPGFDTHSLMDALASGVRVGVGQDGPDEVPEVELDWAPLAVARLEGQAVQRRKGGALRGLPEGVYLRSQRRVGRKCRGVDEPLDVGEREQIEPGHPLGE